MFERVLIANRGEIAIRIARAVAELEVESVAVFATDDVASLHVAKADRSVELAGTGAAAYLDIDALVAAARAADCDCLHPGYGFLSENAALAAACAQAGIVFIGPAPATLDMLGDKTTARALAEEAEVPVLAGTGAATADEAEAFVATHGAAIIKAVAGGGGRGMRVVRESHEVQDAFLRASSEARAAFGNGSLYVERLMEGARHVEVQVLGDGENATHLGERDCSIQRRHQKLIEIAPAPGLADSLRQGLHEAALELARACGYRGAGTFEFLVDTASAPPTFAFIEANPRLQVEHTVTEEVTGIDLVRAQFEIAAGRRLAELDLDYRPVGFAIQARVNMERMTEGGDALPAGGTLAAFDPPSGPGLRTDTFGYAGYATSPHHDSLLAKVVASSRSPFRAVAAKLSWALREFRIEGVDTNIAYLRAILDHPDFLDGLLSTGFAAERPLRFDQRPLLHVASKGPTQGGFVHCRKANANSGLARKLDIRTERVWKGCGSRGCGGGLGAARGVGRAGVGRGRRSLPGADGGAPFPGRAAEDRRDAAARRAPARRVAGAARLLGAGAEVRRSGPLDRLGLPHPARPPAPARQRQPVPDPAGAAGAEPGLAGAGAVRAAPGRRLAGALRASAAAGDVRRPGAPPRHGVPRRELDARRARAASAACAAATARCRPRPSWCSRAPWLAARGRA